MLQERATREEAVTLLIAPTRAAGALDAADDEGNTALQYACLHGLCGVAEQLLAAGAKPDTALHAALERGQAEVALLRLFIADSGLLPPPIVSIKLSNSF